MLKKLIMNCKCKEKWEVVKGKEKRKIKLKENRRE